MYKLSEIVILLRVVPLGDQFRWQNLSTRWSSAFGTDDRSILPIFPILQYGSIQIFFQTTGVAPQKVLATIVPWAWSPKKVLIIQDDVKQFLETVDIELEQTRKDKGPDV